MSDSPQSPVQNQPQTPPSQAAPTPSEQTEDQKLEQELDTAAETTKQTIHNDPEASKKLATTPELQDEVVDIERDLLDQIITRLDDNKMTPEEAQKLSNEFLSFLPITDKKDLLAKLLQLSKDSSATQGIYLKYAKPAEEDERQRKLTLMSQHIQQGNIEQALAVAKGDQNAR
jgi:hypothetical protein